jgi:hypothetical protein
MRLPTADLLRKIGFPKPPWAHRYLHARVFGRQFDALPAPTHAQGAGSPLPERLLP